MMARGPIAQLAEPPAHNRYGLGSSPSGPRLTMTRALGLRPPVSGGAGHEILHGIIAAGVSLDSQLKILIELQALDTRIAGLDGEAVRLPQEIAAIRAAADDARKAVEDARARLDTARKDTRA